MAQQIINIGTVPGDDTGDKLYIGGDKINDNFTELYAATALNTAKVTNATHTGDVTGSGALTIANTGVTAGTYYNATMTVNAKGQVTAASSGTATYTALKYTGTFALNAADYTTCVTTLASTVVPYSIMMTYTTGGVTTLVTQNHEVQITTSGAFLALKIYSIDNISVKIYIIY